MLSVELCDMVYINVLCFCVGSAFFVGLLFLYAYGTAPDGKKKRKTEIQYDELSLHIGVSVRGTPRQGI